MFYRYCADTTCMSSGKSLIVVSVGTDHHPFDRLVQWVDDWSAGQLDVEVILQRGTSAPPKNLDSSELIPHPDLLELFARATAVISHGGPSTVMDARMTGRLPIVVPRDPAHGEHVDEHQLRFAEHLRKHDLARIALTEPALVAALEEALASPMDFTVPVDASSINGIVEFGRVVDELLNTKTPLLPSTAAGAEELDSASPQST